MTKKKKKAPEIRNPILGMIATEDEDIVFELFGDSGVRREFVYDSEPSLEQAILMMESGLQVLGRIHDVGFRQAIGDFGLEENQDPDRDLDSPLDIGDPDGDIWLDNPDDHT